MNLQDVADELAESLNRSVAILDPDHRHVASGEPGSAAGAVRRLAAAPEPAATSERAGLTVAITDEFGALGALWLATDDLPALTALDYSLIDAAADTARRILGGRFRSRGTSTRGAVFADLLAADADTRRQAFAEAVARRWLRRDRHTIVRAVQLERGPSAIERMALARRISALRSSGLTFIGDRDDALLFVSVEHPGSSVGDVADGLIRREARECGMPARSIGSARHDVDHEDLSPTAESARLAAQIVGGLPHRSSRGDIAELGSWVLMASVAADSSQLAMLSPGAASLLADGDELQRHTIEVYLDVCGRVRDACEILHIHRTTLYYRLDNMPPAVKDALREGLTRSTLHLCLKLMRYRNSLEAA